MKSIQYTIRSVPPKIDQRLRARAKQSGRSLNQVVVETLAKGSGIATKPVVYNDLDWFKGALGKDEGWDEAMRWLESLPKDMD